MKLMRLIIISLLLLSIKSNAQKLITYNGVFDDGGDLGRSPHGNATYTYYENVDTRAYIKHGTFKYMFNGSGGYTGFTQTIVGDFKDGLKNGPWTYIINLNDAHIDYGHSTYLGSNAAYNNRNNYSTGTITLKANYKNGFAHGRWQEVISYKQRAKIYTGNGYAWSKFEPVKTTTIQMNFDNGNLVGDVVIDDGFYNKKITGKFDNEGYADGTWIVTSPWETEELIYKDKCYYQYLKRDSKGQLVPQDVKDMDGTWKTTNIVKFEKEYETLKTALSLSENDRLENGYSLVNKDSWARQSIKGYLGELLNDEYFLYKNIGGDSTYENGFTGGGQLNVEKKNFISIKEIPEFVNAENQLKENKLIEAITNYRTVYNKHCKVGNLCSPADKMLLEKKIQELELAAKKLFNDLSENYQFITTYYNERVDAFDKEFDSVCSKFNLGLSSLSPDQYFNLPERIQDCLNKLKENGYVDLVALQKFIPGNALIEGAEPFSELIRKFGDEEAKNIWQRMIKVGLMKDLVSWAGNRSTYNPNEILKNLKECVEYKILTPKQEEFITSCLKYRIFLSQKANTLKTNQYSLQYWSENSNEWYEFFKISKEQFLENFDIKNNEFQAAKDILNK